MVNRVKNLWLNVSQSLGFIPGLIVVAFGVAGVLAVQIDRSTDLSGMQQVFSGDAAAARTVLSVIAGSLITVAGLTFSTTIVVLQLASSQFSPRILRTFFGDRLTQLTIGTYVGTFVYALLVLRAVGSFTEPGFVPRLGVTMASLLGIAAVVLLVVFLHHVSQMVQVSHVTADIAGATLAGVDRLYPEPFDEGVSEPAPDELLAGWRRQPAGQVLPRRPGYVQRIGLDDLADHLGEQTERMAVLVCAGDFVSVDTPLVEVWPAAVAESARRAIIGAVAIASERDLAQDVDFGIRQLVDTALKALSPGINDPMTAITCIGYLRSILVRLTERALPARVRRFTDPAVTVLVRRREFDEYLDSVLQINRYVGADAWVIAALLETLAACDRAARRCGADERAAAVRGVARVVAEQAAPRLRTAHDRQRVDRLMAPFAVES